MGSLITGRAFSVYLALFPFDVGLVLPIMAPLDGRSLPVGAPVAELVDAVDSKSAVRTGVLVRVRPGAPHSNRTHLIG